jgi:hypothetical protein
MMGDRMGHSLSRIAVLAGLLIFTVSGVAAAQSSATFFIGTSTFDANSYAGHKSGLTYGGSVAFKRDMGVEVDWGYSNHVTGVAEVVNDSARTLMVSFIADLGPQRGRVQPYLVVGGGWMHLRVAESADLFKFGGDSNDYAINVGGGAQIGLRGSLGARVDVRYFRGFEDFPAHSSMKPSFIRISGGISLGF